MTHELPSVFIEYPIAHRALHDKGHARPENSAAAVQAAVDANYGIEIDVQLSADKDAVVFHDYDLNRLTDRAGAVNHWTAKDLTAIALKDGGGQGIPTLSEVLNLIAGRVPLLIEIKDQDKQLGPEVGALEKAVADAIDDYKGPVAVMSFNPYSVAAMQTLAPRVPRGLVTEYFRTQEWNIPEDRLSALRKIEDYEKVGACFISHSKRDLQCSRVAELKEMGARVLCWTVRSREQESNARTIAENITFEDYLPERRS